MTTNLRNSVVLSTALAFAAATMPGCHDQAVVTGQLGEGQYETAIPPRPGPRPTPKPKPKPAPKPAPKPGAPKPKPKPGPPKPKKPGGKKPAPKKPGPKKPGTPKKPAPGKTGTAKSKWTTKRVLTIITNVGLIGVAVITVLGFLVDKSGDLVKKIRDLIKKINGQDVPADPPADPPPPPPKKGPKPKVKPPAAGAPMAALDGGDAGEMLLVSCVSTDEDTIECWYDIEGDCDPTTLGFNESCLTQVETCEVDGDGCDPTLEECCGDDTADLYCVVDELGGGAPCVPGDPCCDVAGDACDLEAGLVDADDPTACDGPIIIVEECEIIGDTDGDGADEYCVELDDGTALGGGSCCGDALDYVDLCTCAIDYCEADDPTLCAEVDIPGSDHLCSDSTFCAAYADTYVEPTAPDECSCWIEECDELDPLLCTESEIVGSDHLCADAAFCDVYIGPDPPQCICVIDHCDESFAPVCSEEVIPASDHSCAETDFCDVFAGPTVDPTVAVEVDEGAPLP